MKKIISIIIAAVMAFCLCLPAFAAQSATFAVNVVSEDNTKAVVSIDYDGGTAFNCLDFEVTLSSRVSVEKVRTVQASETLRFIRRTMKTALY